MWPLHKECSPVDCFVAAAVCCLGAAALCVFEQQQESEREEQDNCEIRFQSGEIGREPN